MKSPLIPYQQKELLEKWAQALFNPLKNGFCVTVLFAAGGGKKTLINQLLHDKPALKAIFGPIFPKILFIYVNPEDIAELSNEHYLQLILTRLVEAMRHKKIAVNTLDYKTPLVSIKSLLLELTGNDYRVIFILNDFEFTLSLSHSIYLNLETMRAINKISITYLFLSSINVLRDDILTRLGTLKFSISQKVYYHPITDKERASYIVDQNTKMYDLIISPEIKKTLMELCGGHPRLLKYAVNIIAEKGSESYKNLDVLKKVILHSEHLRIVCDDIWGRLGEKEQAVVMHVSSTKDVNSQDQKSVDYLKNIGLINQNSNGSYSVFSTLFENYIEKKLPKNTLIYDVSSDKLFLGSKVYDDTFTFQEFNLIKFFLEHANEVVSRDQVAEAIWGKNYLEKYSDYSIDKVISVIRKKFDSIGFPAGNLLTLKKRGFRFVNTT